jgi:hypothetical protein
MGKFAKSWSFFLELLNTKLTKLFVWEWLYQKSSWKYLLERGIYVCIYAKFCKIFGAATWQWILKRIHIKTEYILVSLNQNYSEHGKKHDISMTFIFQPLWHNIIVWHICWVKQNPFSDARVSGSTVAAPIFSVSNVSHHNTIICTQCFYVMYAMPPLLPLWQWLLWMCLPPHIEEV